MTDIHDLFLRNWGPKVLKIEYSGAVWAISYKKHFWRNSSKYIGGNALVSEFGIHVSKKNPSNVD